LFGLCWYFFFGTKKRPLKGALFINLCSKLN
jgi:hypothetical protein